MILFKLTEFILFRKIIFFLKKFIYQKKIKTFRNESLINTYCDYIKKRGFHVVENFLDKSECDLIIQAMNNFNTSNPDRVWKDKFDCEYRLFGAEKINLKIMNFFSNEFLSMIGSRCFGSFLSNLMTMANKIEYKNNNQGSGGGWHRDDVNFQFKAILYLSDVNEKNGPFQLIEDSNNLFDIIKDTIRAKLNVLDTRIPNEKILLLKSDRIKTITGKAGTLILVDTSLIHRGCPLEEGVRYALTNYYYPYYQVDSMRSHFLPKI